MPDILVARVGQVITSKVYLPCPLVQKVYMLWLRPEVFPVSTMQVVPPVVVGEVDIVDMVATAQEHSQVVQVVGAGVEAVAQTS
jgi:hypothetical protein